MPAGGTGKLAHHTLKLDISSYISSTFVAVKLLRGNPEIRLMLRNKEQQQLKGTVYKIL
jgi:hypothetical protein